MKGCRMFKPSEIYVMVNNHIIENENKKEVFGYTGNKYTYHIFKRQLDTFSPIDIMAAVNRVFGCDISEMDRTQPKPHARRMFYFIIREVARIDLSLKKTADLLGQDHATVLHHIRETYNSLDIADTEVIYNIKSVCQILGLEMIVKKR
jgi:chromosomal replication initiation ATPase DnaA